MKIACPRCRGPAKVVYIQNSGEGRAWIRLPNFIWCPTESGMVRISDKRRVRSDTSEDANLVQAVADDVAKAGRPMTARELYVLASKHSEDDFEDLKSFESFLDFQVAAKRIRLDNGKYSAIGDP